MRGGERTAGQGREAGRGPGNGTSNDGGGGSNSVSTSGSATVEGVKTNSQGESHYYNCRETDYWAHECPKLSSEQQQQLHMNLNRGEGGKGLQEEVHQLMHVMLAKEVALPNNGAYLDGCSTVREFKNKKYLEGIKKLASRIKINCNAGTVMTNLMEKYGSIASWYIPKGIENIFSMHELEKLHRITYGSWQGFYKVHMPSGSVKFYKDKQGLPYIDSNK